MKFSIIVVTFNRNKTLLECLKSISDQSIKDPHEVIVILNGDLAYIEKYKSLFKNFTFIHIPHTTNSNARNFAIEKAQGEYIFFLEDDCILPAGYFSHLNFGLTWDVLGGPDQTPLYASARQTLIGRALASPLCMGPAFKRHSRRSLYNHQATDECLMICNLWFKRSLFSDENFKFNKNLFRNEAHFLLKDMAIKNKIFHYDPDLFVYHQRLPSLEKLGAALIQSAKCRVATFSLIPKKNEIIYFVPFLFSICFFFMIFHPNRFFFAAISLYTFCVLLYGMITHRRLSLRLVFLHYFVLFSYNIGLFKGWWLSLDNFYRNMSSK